LSWTRSSAIEVVKAEQQQLRAQAAHTFEVTSSNFALIRTGDEAGENARAMIEALRRAAGVYEAEGERRARDAIARESQRHTRGWTASVKAGTQIDIAKLLADDDLVNLMSVKSEQFVSLIKNLSADTIYRIEREVLTSVFGRSNAEVAKALQEIEGIARNRARLIARDQASKLNAAMNEMRQQQAGIERFRWKTILDGRERASHHAKNNKIFAWGDRVEKPGDAVNCRCRALAIIEEYES
jgi:SPP1 gp7 family putative phage head morphogenesis protein